ncbi:hypothetical protein [Persephonella sp.]
MTVRYFLNLLFVSLLLLANYSTALEKERELEVKILEKIASDIFKKKKIVVYLGGYPEERIIKYSKKFRITNDCEKADLLILREKIKLRCKGKIILTTNYYLLLELPDAVGAFYWKKGRPHLIFFKERLEKKGIRLPEDYEKYIIENSDENDS